MAEDSRANILAIVNDLLPDRNIAIISDLALLRLITDISDEFSKDFPQELMTSYTGDGSTFEFALPTTWQEGFSTIIKIEWPYDADIQQPSYVESRDWMIYRDNIDLAKRSLRFLADIPSSGDIIRLSYTATQLVDAPHNTVPSGQLLAYAYLVLAHCAAIHANYYANTSDANNNADAVVYQSMAEKWETRHKAALETYQRLINKSQTPIAFINLDTTLAGSGSDYLTHPRAWR